ncbi:MAG: hypothetical protein KKC24_08660 [Gammaproteobacteria bacterium]|nr:hypothetical protein [Gammaproteobacteria bacterium]MBU0818908.1 hypothetical protein [Gammaproteobacteria bacterium]MBU0844312.1 hypothetical protein [Gammaproteobacteria bacterium]MBU1843533.1 hypothetical protein [Gammaproteobacteria bacterium]
MAYYIRPTGEAILSLAGTKYTIDSGLLLQNGTEKTSEQQFYEGDVDFKTSFNARLANQSFTWSVEYTEHFGSGDVTINSSEYVSPTGVTVETNILFIQVQSEEEDE